MGVGHFSRELMMMIVSKLYKRFLWKKNMLKKSKKPKNVTDGSTTREIKVQVPASRCSLLPQWAVYGFSL